MMKNCLRAAAIVAMCAMFAVMTGSEARAGFLNVDLGTTLVGTSPNSAPPWITMHFEDTAANTVTLTVTSSLEVAGEFTTVLGFNVKDSLAGGLTIQQTSGSPTAAIAQGLGALDLPGVKGFDVSLSWPSANSGPRFDATDVMVFTITKTGLTSADFNYLNEPWKLQGGKVKTLQPDASYSGPKVHAAAHVQGITSPTGGSFSATIGDPSTYPDPDPIPTPTPTPEPSTLLMGAVAMVGLGVARFRSKKS